jgi:hypothetical protein
MTALATSECSTWIQDYKGFGSYHLAQPRSSDWTPSLFSLRSSFLADDTDGDVVITMIRLFFRLFGIIQGAFMVLVVGAFSVWMLKNAVAIGLANLDTVLIKVPLLGPVYERFFRKETYYRHDTRVMYLQTVPVIVKRLVDDLTAAKGVTLSERIEGKPFQTPKVGI